MDKFTPKPKTEKLPPIHETETYMNYLGVKLGKATNTENAPKRETYANFVEDDFSMALEQKIATAWLQGQPILIEGGTSIGKTTTAKKMCADLGWEPHYINLNSNTDPETMMGRYLPNKDKKEYIDAEYKFIDGAVTKALRTETGKTKVIILDELNAASPAALIRLHEVLDALERGGTVTLTEDDGEILSVNKEFTKVIALTNPSKGYLERNPLDPAQLRRWVYQKELNELPRESFLNIAKAKRGIQPMQASETKIPIRNSLETKILSGELSPMGEEQIIEKYTEFHHAAQKLIEKRELGRDQSQKFMFSDHDEMNRVYSFVDHFYNGDITETYQNALRYYYTGKVTIIKMIYK
jgi:MoxR-like ATPase